MVAQLPRQLKAFNTYIDGTNYAGRCDTATLPPLAFQTEDYRGGGMDAPVKLELGMQAMQASIVLSDYSPDVIALIGRPDVPITLRGSVQAQGAKSEPVVVTMRGMLSTLDFSQWQPGTKSTKTLTYDLTYFRFRQRDEELCEIDILNMVRRFGGVDQLADIRNDIGL